MLIRKLKAGFGSVFSIFRKKPCLECRRLAAENQSLQAELLMTRAAYASRGSSAVSHPHVTSRDIPATRQGLGNAPSFPSDAPTVLPPIGGKSRWAHLKASVIGFGKSELQDAHEVVVHGDNVVLIL